MFVKTTVFLSHTLNTLPVFDKNNERKWTSDGVKEDMNAQVLYVFFSIISSDVKARSEESTGREEEGRERDTHFEWRANICRNVHFH